MTLCDAFYSLSLMTFWGHTQFVEQRTIKLGYFPERGLYAFQVISLFQQTEGLLYIILPEGKKKNPFLKENNVSYVTIDW